LTITLPDFCKDFEEALAIGYIPSTSFRSFRKDGAIPSFLKGMLKVLFSQETGRLNDEPRADFQLFPEIVGSVRQICLAFKKLEIECSPKRIADSIEAFVQTERQLSELSLDRCDIDDFHRVASLLWAPIVSHISVEALVPTHGPGATYEGLSGNRKYSWLYWHERLEEYFPFLENGYSVSSSLEREFEGVTFIPPAKELPVRVTPVPKTLKAPRIIAIEPVCNQYVQQGIRNELYARIESSSITAGHVNFTDQSVNRSLALAASKDKSLATIDLSEASDRVPHELALSMFSSNPPLMWLIDACRSRTAELPDGRLIPLKKFASMGSALCFPVEAMYFYTCCVVSLLRIRQLPVNLRNVRKVASEVFVYGDDIILPAHETVETFVTLLKYNCKVNIRKSFWNGKFRESCGLDAYDGVEVTPTYVRRLCPNALRQAQEIISWTETANHLYKRGYWRSASYMFSKVERIVGELPYVSDNSPGLGRFSYLGYRTINRWNRRYQQFEVTCLVPSPIYRTD